MRVEQLLHCAINDAGLLLAGLGVDPWNVLRQGLSRRLGLGAGTVASALGIGLLVDSFVPRLAIAARRAEVEVAPRPEIVPQSH